MGNTKRTVVFAGDYAYIRQIETAIKSLCRHNSHVKVYVLNQDIPQEWFSRLRIYLQEMGGDLIDCKLSCFGAGVGFNAGVLLINNKKWKLDNIRQQLVELTEKEHENVGEGDQSILNILFQNSYYQLEDTYNFQIGFDAGAAEKNHAFIFEIPLTPLPKILHYISPDKPWKQFSVGRLREEWWKYSFMEWSYIVSSWKEKGVFYSADIYKPKLTCMNLTNSWCVEKIDYLVEQLPEVHFYIAAHTFMSDELKRLSKYQNVTLYPNSFPILVEKLLQSSDIYLDLNLDQKLVYIYDLVKKYNKPMLSFESSRYQELTDDCYAGLYSTKKPEDLVEAIKFYMREKNYEKIHCISCR